MNHIEQYKSAITELCDHHKVMRLYAFGSVLTDKFTSSSDVDLIVDFANVDLLDYADNYFELKFSLQTILQRKVDLLEEKALRNPFFKKAILKQRQLVYER